MNDIEFDIEAVQNFGVEVKAIRDGVEGLVEQIERAVNEVAQSWQDDSLVHAEEKLTTVNKSILQACDQIQEIVEKKVREQLEWADRYRSIV